MRIPSSLPITPRHLALVLFAASNFAPQIRAVSFTAAASPNLDLSQLGRVAFAGDFDSASLYSYVGQSEATASTNGSQSILGRYPSGAFADLQASDATIETMCSYFGGDGSFSGVVLGGNFTSLGGQSTQGMAMYMPSNNTLQPLAGLTGQVYTVFCSTAQQTAYVGGSFTGGNSANAIAWTNGWQNLPFAGFNGPVSSIAQLPNGNLVFGGTFTGTGNLSSPTTTTQYEQVVNIGSGNVTTVGTTSQAGYDDPANVVCKTSNQTGPGNEWLLEDNTPGYLTASFGFGFVPTRLRLYNTQVAGYGTKAWRFVYQETGGIMNFTYYGSNGLESCTATCPLANNASYQDFYFVNPVGMNSFRVYISDWYGNGAGLGGFELFQNDIYVSAIQAFNAPVCGNVSTSVATASTTGSWSVTPSGTSNSDYLTASLPNGTFNSTGISVVFYPDIQQSGNYSVTLYTPGCISDDTCSSRGIINVTSNLSTPTATTTRPVSTQLYQTNDYQKYDQIYFGYIDATNSEFTPSVTLTPVAGQSGSLTIVAQSVHFELIASASAGGLNGLYEFNPNGSTINSVFSASTIDNAGLQLNPGAQVYALAVSGNTTYVGGALSSSSINNIMAVVGGNATSLSGGGLNDPVQALYVNGSSLYAAGSFSNTNHNSSTGLNNIAVYSLTSGSWAAIGAGVNGIIYNIVPLTVNISSSPVDCLAFSGYFDQVNAFANYSAFPVNNIAIYVPSSNNWLHNVDATSFSLSGRLTTVVDVPDNGQLFAGAVTSEDLSTSGALSLSTSGTLALAPLPISIQPLAQASTTSSRKRAILRKITQGVVAGAFYDDNGLNITILGGQFTANTSKGSTIHNLAFINGTDNNAITGLVTDTASSDAILALATQGTLLFAGGTIASGILIYDLASASLTSAQPPAITGGSSTVNAIVAQPSASAVYVGGSFSSAGILSCPALCVYNISSSQWVSPGAGLSTSSVITSLQWASDTQLIIAGNMTIGGNYTTLAQYNLTSKTFTGITDAGSSSSVPGQISTFTPTDNTFTSFFVAGTSANSSSAFLSRYDGTNSSWTVISGLEATSVVEGLQLLSLTSDHAATTLVPAGQTLLVTGKLQLSDYGNVSAALFDGASFLPFLLTTLSDGSPGTIRAAFVQNSQNLISGSGGTGSSGPSYLATGYVVLIALAIALALIFLLVVAGILIGHLRRRREGYVPAPTQYTAYNTIPAVAAAGQLRQPQLAGEEEKMQGHVAPGPHPAQRMMQRLPPEHLFGSIGAGGVSGAKEL